MHGLARWVSGRESACYAGNPGSISGSEDSQEKETATHSGILAWEIPRTEEPEVLQCMGSHGIRHGRATGHWAQFSHLSII